MSNLPTILFLAVITLSAVTLNNASRFRQIQIDADAVQNSIIQIAQAQHRRVSDRNLASYGEYATTIQQLETEGYLPIWTGDTRFTLAFPSASGFAIDFQAETVGDATRVAERLGETAEITSGTTVRFGFADPESLTVLRLFVKREGDSMFGSLEMEAGSGADILMNQNTIRSAGNIILHNDAGDANITTDTANAGSLTVQTFRVIN